MKSFPKRLSFADDTIEPVCRALGAARFYVDTDGSGRQVEAGRMGEQGFYFCDADGTRHRAHAAWTGEELWLRVDGRTWNLRSAEREASAQHANIDPTRVCAPMTGTIVKLLVATGASVEEGDDLIILTAMKMEHHLKAGAAGKIAEILCSEGESVDEGMLLARLLTESDPE